MKSSKSWLSRFFTGLLRKNESDEMEADESWPPPFVPSASVYLRKGKFYIESEDRSVTGFRYSGDTIKILSEEVSDSELGRALLQVLAAGKDGVPHKSWEESKKNEANTPILRAAGVKSWRTFYKNCRSCSISKCTDKLEFLPMRLRGSGAEGIGEEEFFLPADSSLEEIGRAVRRCLERSR